MRVLWLGEKKLELEVDLAYGAYHAGNIALLSCSPFLSPLVEYPDIKKKD